MMNIKELDFVESVEYDDETEETVINFESERIANVFHAGWMYCEEER